MRIGFIGIPIRRPPAIQPPTALPILNHLHPQPTLNLPQQPELIPPILPQSILRVLQPLINLREHRLILIPLNILTPIQYFLLLKQPHNFVVEVRRDTPTELGVVVPGGVLEASDAVVGGEVEDGL